MRERQLRTFRFQQTDRQVDIILDDFDLARVPFAELVRDLDIPRYPAQRYIPSVECASSSLLHRSKNRLAFAAKSLHMR
jgi:hypothetical protein